MSVLYIALPVALLLSASAVAAFLWSLNQGQYDDLDTPQVRMLFDDTPRKKTEEEQPSEKNDPDQPPNQPGGNGI